MIQSKERNVNHINIVAEPSDSHTPDLHPGSGARLSTDWLPHRQRQRSSQGEPDRKHHMVLVYAVPNTTTTASVQQDQIPNSNESKNTKKQLDYINTTHEHYIKGSQIQAKLSPQ